MQQLLVYIFKWALCLAIMYIPFPLLMRKETFHAINRAILLFCIVIAAILPFFDIVVPIEIEIPATESLNSLSQLATTATVEKTEQITISHTSQILFAIYLTGVTVSLLYTIINIVKIKQAITRGTLWHEKNEHYTLYCHANNTPPFSWFNNAVISESDYKECGKEIIAHEEGHIRLRHSWDILFINIVKAVQWFNPFIYMLLNDIKDIHEYEADRYALARNSDARSYQLLILKKAIGEKNYSIANNFIRKSVRKRVEMMMRKKSRKSHLIKGAYIPVAAAVATLIFAKPQYIYGMVQENDIQQQDTTDIKEESTIDCGEITDTKETIAPPLATPPERKAKRISAIKEEIKKEVTETTIATGNHEMKTAEETTVVGTEQFAARVRLDDEFFDTTAAENGDVKCSLILEFRTDKKGEIHDIGTTACNVSINAGRETPIEQMLPRVREKAIAAATNYILSKEWQRIYINDDREPTHYTANITMHTGADAVSTEKQKTNDTFWIGTTPIRQ